MLAEGSAFYVNFKETMKLEILQYPDPKLKEIGEPVTKFDAELHKLLDDMTETMYSANGIGLAATQVGKKLRLFVIDIGEPKEDGDPPRKLYEFINPQISKGQGKVTFEEGCLSVPNYTDEVTRKESILVKYQDRFGAPQTLEAHGLLAVCIQHEHDHLDGIVFVDRLSPLKRRMARRKIERAVAL